jgi:hypothetical protein
MATCERKVMCAECPFRRNAAPGWLGPWTPKQINQIAESDEDFICHKSVEALAAEGLSDIEIDTFGQHCVGMLRYRNTLAKLSRDPQVARWQRELREVPDQPVLAARTFMSHHERLPRSAVLSDCKTYRYALWRQFGESERCAAFIMLNPSTADAETDDPTIRRCVDFAASWGCGRLLVLNLFAVRATSPKDMKAHTAPVGPENKSWFERLLPKHDGPVICAWGGHGGHRSQNQIVLGWLKDLKIEPVSLGMTRDGQPRHPLFLPKHTPPVQFLPGGTGQTDRFLVAHDALVCTNPLCQERVWPDPARPEGRIRYHKENHFRADFRCRYRLA